MKEVDLIRKAKTYIPCDAQLERAHCQIELASLVAFYDVEKNENIKKELLEEIKEQVKLFEKYTKIVLE